MNNPRKVTNTRGNYLPLQMSYKNDSTAVKKPYEMPQVRRSCNLWRLWTKPLRVIHLAAGAGPGAGVMRFMLLHPILSQHWHPGYIYPPHSLTHLVSCRITTWKVCFTHQLKAVQQDCRQLFRLAGSVCLLTRDFEDSSGVFFLDEFLIDTVLKHVHAHSTHQESSWTECIQRKIISCSL